MKTKSLHLLAFYTRVPRDPKKTHTKGYGKDENNYSYNEEVHFTKGLKDKDLLKAGVILNITEKKVVKCSMNSAAEFLDLYAYYKKNYPQYIQILEEGLYGEKPEVIEQNNID